MIPHLLLNASILFAMLSIFTPSVINYRALPGSTGNALWVKVIL